MNTEEFIAASAQITKLLLELAKTRKSSKDLEIIQEIQLSQQKIFSHIIEINQRQFQVDSQLATLAHDQQTKDTLLQKELQEIKANQNKPARYS